MSEKSFLERVLLDKTAPENIYEKIVILSIRARQINMHRLEAFREELNSMGVLDVHIDHVINTEGWQEVLAKTYEDKDPPLMSAAKELEQGKLLYTYVTEQP